METGKKTARSELCVGMPEVHWRLCRAVHACVFQLQQADAPITTSNHV